MDEGSGGKEDTILLWQYGKRKKDCIIMETAEPKVYKVREDPDAPEYEKYNEKMTSTRRKAHLQKPFNEKLDRLCKQIKQKGA